jgi:hypothetical protein
LQHFATDRSSSGFLDAELQQHERLRLRQQPDYLLAVVERVNSLALSTTQQWLEVRTVESHVEADPAIETTGDQHEHALEELH